MIINDKYSIYVLPHELPNNLKLMVVDHVKI